MRKLIIFILTVVALAAFPSQRASAQYFDHLALGISAGVDGFGLQLAAPIGKQFQMRAGYSCLPPMWKPHKSFHFEEGEDHNDAEVDIEALVLFHNANLMFDWHPAGKGFFFSVGAFAGPSTALTVRNRNQFLAEEDWGTSGIWVGDVLVTSDQNGNVAGKIKIWPVRPYVGFGYGTPVRADKRVGFNIELGTCFTNYKVSVTGRDYSEYGTGEPTEVTVTSENLNHEDKGIVDKMRKFPILPMLRFGVFFRLF